MRRALSIGIDDYQFAPLRGCVDDATRLCHVLSSNDDGSPNFDCRTLLGPLEGLQDDITRAVLRENIEELFASEADIALLHFSGHGTVNNLGGYLVTQDAARYDEGVAMSEVLRMADASKAREVVILLDCCHAGALGNVPEVNNRAALREGISILTASRGDQPSVEDDGGGLFTSLVVDALSGGAADLRGDVTAASIYGFAETALGAWSQRPLFKAHVSSLISLRRCDPPVATALLRRIPQYFPLPAEDLPLDPSYEKSSLQADPARCAAFDDLLALSKVRLVVPVDAPHMYDAAIGNKACRLTPTGRYYWRLAMDRRI